MQSKNEKGDRVWAKEDIDTSFSQVHALHLADIDGDGLSEFATGKRIYAHASENGATAEPCIHIYKYDRNHSSWLKTVVYRGEPASAAPLNPEVGGAWHHLRALFGMQDRILLTHTE